MSASLVGSEMCIRDRNCTGIREVTRCFFPRPFFRSLAHSGGEFKRCAVCGGRLFNTDVVLA
eukprot:14269926-Alexandrium_andersonii.AAC.1